MGKKITDHVTWVGKVDWDLQKFHGQELSTHRGSSYNSYLIRDEKTVLIDTVWQPFDKEFVARLKNEIDLKDIDYIVMNHNEIDHSGALPELMREIPGTPIYCTANGKKIIQGHYHEDWNFQIVKLGDTLNIGKGTLTFIPAPFCHWPDTMFTYYDTDAILFSNDGFGQHYATESLFNDLNSKDEIFYEAKKYYCNILNLYGQNVKKAIQTVVGLNVPLKMICPSHGVIWRDDPMQIVEAYQKWDDAYQENQVTIIYDTMWNSTRKMAEAIGAGIREAAPDTVVKIMDVGKQDKNDILTEVFNAKAILVGCPTINQGLSYAVGGILEMMKGLKFKNKKAAAFGSYGWAPQGQKRLNAALADCGFEMVNDGKTVQWVPDEKALEECVQYGRDFAKAL